MVEEFDKEIDTLLRQTAQGETVFAGKSSDSRFQIADSNHLDADEISAFAENALPEKAKQKYMLHLADCSKCRKNLSSLISLNAEQPSEIVYAGEKQFVQMPIPWYRRLFAGSNSAYTMGALVLVFSGIVAYTVLQNAGNSPNAEVSQTYEKQTGGKGMSSDGDAALNESYSSSNTTATNTLTANAASMNSSNSAANSSAMPSAPGATTNSNSAALRDETDKDLKVVKTPVSPAKEPNKPSVTDDLDVAGRSMPKEREAESQSDSQGQNEQQPIQTQESLAQNQTNITPDSRNVKRAPMPVMRSENRSKKLEESRKDAAEKSGSSTTNVGGKTFKRTNDVWYDSAYRGQATVNIARGTDQYKKLDSGLRGIAENFGGTVVVVWKSKAYRIQ